MADARPSVPANTSQGCNVQPAQRGLNHGVLRWREHFVAAFNEFVRRKAIGILLPAPVSLYPDGEPQGGPVGKGEHLVDGRNSLGMLSEKSSPRTAAKCDRQRFTGAAGAPIDKHGNIRNVRQLVGRARHRRVRNRSFHFSIPRLRHSGRSTLSDRRCRRIRRGRHSRRAGDPTPASIGHMFPPTLPRISTIQPSGCDLSNSAMIRCIFVSNSTNSRSFAGKHLVTTRRANGLPSNCSMCPSGPYRPTYGLNEAGLASDSGSELCPPFRCASSACSAGVS